MWLRIELVLQREVTLSGRSGQCGVQRAAHRRVTAESPVAAAPFSTRQAREGQTAGPSPSGTLSSTISKFRSFRTGTLNKYGPHSINTIRRFHQPGNQWARQLTVQT